MKPVDFELHRPGTLDEALEVLAAHGHDGKVLAGGQSLVPLLNFRLARPEHVIDLSRIGSLRNLRRTRSGLLIGAMVTYDQADRSAAIADGAPLVAAALPHIAHQGIRARGTIGGSVAHGDPAAELPAVFTALDATMLAASRSGTREIPARDFFITNLVTALADDELLTEIRLGPVAPRTGAAFNEVGRRHGDFALAGAAAQISLAKDATIFDVRIALTGVSPKPHRATEAEQLLMGQRVDAQLWSEAAAIVRRTVDPSGDLHATADYRRDVAGTMAGRALAEAARRATRPGTESLEATA
jgi:aerobic carbon-monoxide dehydrogenase medium subunit